MEREWYRKQAWTEADEADFRARLGRAKKQNRPQYLRIQAGTLIASGDQYLSQAVALLDEVIEGHPHSLEISSALAQKGACLRRLGNVAGAADAYAASVARMRAVPKMQLQDGWLDYGLLVATERLSPRYSDALEVLEEFSKSSPLMLPADWFSLHASRALIFAELRRVDLATEEARLALGAMEQRHSGVAYHPTIGLSGNADRHLRERLVRIAGCEQPSRRGVRSLRDALFGRKF